MSCAHLSCSGCRIRVREGSPEIVLLEERCPLCGATLCRAPSSESVIGFRWFVTEMLTGRSHDRQSGPLARPIDLASRRQAPPARDGLDAGRWLDDGGYAVSEPAAPPQPPAG
jgi:hypothetical protein